MAEKRAFARLRARTEDGDRFARARLQWHVSRRLEKGWRPRTVARHLGLTVEQVEELGVTVASTPTFDPTPRLVRL